MKMRIAIFSDTFFPQVNGVAAVSYQSAKELSKLGHEVMVVVVSPNEQKEKIKKSGNFKVAFLPSIPAFVYPGERVALPVGFSVLKEILKFKPDIIHTHTPFAVGWAAVLAKKITGAKLVGTHHTFYDHYLKHVKLDYPWGKKLSWKATVGYYNFCDLVISPSQSLLDGLIGEGLKGNSEVLINSVDTDLFRPVKNQIIKEKIKKGFGIKKRSICYMGRLSYEKSIDQTIKAFALMLKKIPELNLMLIGDGPERKNLENLAEELKIKDKVIFTGFLFGDNLVIALQANDIFISTSKSESFGISTLESMAVGLPMILVKEKGLAELLRENENGFFAKTDNPADIAEKTVNLLSDSSLHKKFGKASRVLSLQYSHDQITSDLEKKYINLI